MAFAMLLPMVSSLGALEVTVGAGDEYARFPFDFYYKNSLYQCLFYPDELAITDGTITQLKFYSNFAAAITEPRRIKIWLGSTSLDDLSDGFIPSTSLNLVYDAYLSFPAGEDTVTITLQTPYVYTGGNLVMMCNRVWDSILDATVSNFKCQTSTVNRACYLRSDVVNYDPANPPAGTLTGQFPKTTLVYTDQTIQNDLAVLNLTGNTTPVEDSPTTYIAHVFNWGNQSQDTYTVTLHDSDDNLLGTAAGAAVNPGETVEVPLVWTPTQPGEMNIYAKVNLANDQNTANDQSPILSIHVQAQDVTYICIGTGSTTNGPTGAPTPYGTYYKNFRQQYLYKADELIAQGAVPGLFTALAFDVGAINDCSPMPNYTIRLKHTQLASLTTSFEAGDYTQVYHHDNFLPVNGWNVHTFDTPFIWNGVDNILVDIITTFIPGIYTQNASVYYSSTTGTNTSLRFQSDTVPAATNQYGIVSGKRANTRFYIDLSGLGSLSGTVTSDGVPVPDVNTEITDSIYNTVTDALGQYSFLHIYPGNYSVTANKIGYETLSLPVTIVAGQTTTLDFELTATTTVSVTGFVVGSDQPTVGLEAAQVSLTGIVNYSAETDATGHFSIPGVLGGNTYTFLITHPGYSELSGTIIIGNENYDMQILVLTEIAYPPSGVIAEENVTQTQVSLIWNSPIPTPLHDDFEHTDGGWLPTASWDPIGDWEWTNIYDVANFVDTYGSANVIPPPTAYSGTGMWGTKINTNYTNSSGYSYLSKTFNLTGVQNPEIRWWSWENVFGSYDYCQLKVNGNLVWGPAWDFQNTQWRERVVSLAPYANQSNVEIKFELYASAVVNLAGWYIDNVYVGPALNRAVTQAPSITPTWMYGLDEQKASARADKLARLDPSRVLLHSNSEPQRITGYKIWRLLEQDIDSEPQWISLTPSPITDTTFVDTSWIALPSAIYLYAVKAVYTNNVVSAPSFSNVIHKGMMGSISGTVTESGSGNPISGATITAGDYSTTSGADGSYAFLVYQDTYTVTCTKTGYQNAIYPGVVVVGQQITTLDITMIELTLPPQNVQAVIESPASVSVTWDSPNGGETSVTFSDGFESYQDFALSFPPWVSVDLDGNPTYGIIETTWPNIFNPQAFIIFNPSQTSPPFTDFIPHSGDKAAVCFSSSQPPNDDWLISPTLTPRAGDQFSFWAISPTDQYGLERFKVAVSQDSTTPSEFNFISGVSFIEVPTVWTQYSYDLSSYAGQDIRMAINCVSDDALFLAIDDVSMGTAELASVSPNVQIQSTNTLTRCSGTPMRNVYPFDNVYPSARGNRALVGYRVWRLSQGEEGNEDTWTSLTAEPIMETSYSDDGWQNLSDGSYRWAVKAVYSGGGLSPAAMSDPLDKITYIGTIAGLVRDIYNDPISGATVTCGDITANTNDSGAYSIQVETGTYTLVASHPNYTTETVNNIEVYAKQTTTQNFTLTWVDNDESSQTPMVTALKGNYPNPFNPDTTISFSLKEPANVSINIYNIQGKLVKTLLNEVRAAGNHTAIWNGKDNSGRNVASGVYYYRMKSGKYSSTRKMVMLK